MTTPTNPNHPHDEADGLPSLPTHALAWQTTGVCDENARLLVDATYRHRDTLRRDHADIPIQGYEVPSTLGGPAGAMTCGLLITLWRESALCRGACPTCGGLVLALAIGGNDAQWLVTGVCRQCGFLSYRPAPKANLLAELDTDLTRTRYPLPTAHQFLASNGQQHLALLGVLDTLGETLLPPDYYGFIVDMPETMQQWLNPVFGRACHWASRATIYHEPTGARVERVTAVYEGLVAFVTEHLCRTGTLPELDHDGPTQLRYCFPMTSQEPVTFPQRPRGVAAERKWDADEEEGSAFQTSVDELIAKVQAKEDAAEVLGRVQEQLEADPEWTAREAIAVLLHPQLIREAYDVIDDDQVREALELRHDQRVTPTRRIQFLEQYVLPALCEDADETHMFVPVVLTSSDGDELTLMASVQGYSFTIISTDWWGIVKSADVFCQQLKLDGWVAGAKEFKRLPAKQKLAIVTGALGGAVRSA